MVKMTTIYSLSTCTYQHTYTHAIVLSGSQSRQVRKTDVSSTISVHYLGPNMSPEPTLPPIYTSYCTQWHSETSVLYTRLTRLLAGDNYIEFWRRDSFRSRNTCTYSNITLLELLT
jgi:hypothetical protein